MRSPRAILADWRQWRALRRRANRPLRLDVRPALEHKPRPVPPCELPCAYCDAPQATWRPEGDPMAGEPLWMPICRDCTVDGNPQAEPRPMGVPRR